MSQTATEIAREGKKTSLSPKTVFLFIKGFISLGLLVYLFYKADLRQFSRTLYAAQPLYILATGLLYMVCQYLSSYRWQVLLRAHNVSVSVNRLFSFYLVGMFFNNFLPTSVGGDVVKGYDLYRLSGKGKESITTIFLERYTGLAAIILIGLIALIIGYPYFQDPVVSILLIGTAVGFIAGTLMVANRYVKILCLKMTRRLHIPKVGRAISGVYETFGRYKNHKGIFLYSIWVSFGVQILNILVYILLAHALGIAIPWGYFFLFFPIVTVSTMLPLSFNGIGMREGMMVYLFSRIGVPPAQALGLSLTWFFIVICISLLGGLIFTIRKETG